MFWTYILILAIIQGVTEFLPISSSAHLILVRDAFVAMGAPVSQGGRAEELAFDIALHVGSLGAVLIYFRSDVAQLAMGAFDAVRGRASAASRLLFLVIVATLPIMVLGFLLKDVVTFMLRAPEIIAWTTLIFGFFLWASDRTAETRHEPGEMTFRQALLIGLAQCIAIIPGVSRSGITMTAGRFAGFDRPLSARFALLLSIPTILGAGLLAGFDLYRSADVRLTADALVGGLFALITAWIALVLFMNWLKRFTYMPFIIYRIVLGLLLLVLIYGFGWTPGV